MLYGMEDVQATVFSREHVCSLLAELSVSEKNSNETGDISRTGSEFVQTVLADTPGALLQKIVGDLSVEQAISKLSDPLKKLLAQEFLRSSSYPFADTKTFYIGQKYLCPVQGISSRAPVCFKTANGVPLFRIQESPCVYGLYEGLTKKQTLTFNQEPVKIAWDGSGVGCAYLCADGSYFQPLEKGQGFVKRSLSDTADSLTALAFHPSAKVALLGLDTGEKFIFSNDDELVSSEHTAPLSVAKFSQRGSVAVTGDKKGIVCMWSEKGALKQRFLSQDTTPVTALGFDDLDEGALQRLIVGYGSGCARIWDIAKNSTSARSSHHTGSVIQADLNGPVGITLGDEGIIALWAAETGALIRCLDCDPLRTSFIVARSAVDGERDTGDELTIVSAQEDMSNTGVVVCDRYDFDMIRQHAALLNVPHDPVAVIRSAALARAAKKYGEKAARAQRVAKP